VARFLRHIGSSVDKFLRVRSSDLRYRRRRDVFRQDSMSSGHAGTNRQWQIGMHGIVHDQVKVIGAIHVSAGSWMPIIQLTRYVI